MAKAVRNSWEVVFVNLVSDSVKLSSQSTTQKNQALFGKSSSSCRLLIRESGDQMIRDRRKELIRQWLKEPTGSEHELIRKGNVEPHHHNHHPAKPEYAFNCPRQEKREGLACVKDSGKIKVEHVNHNEPSRISKNPLHDHVGVGDVHFS